MVAPQVFQGKKFEVIVPQSSRHLDRFLGASLLSSNASLNILPGSTSDKYWSQQTALTNKHENSVARTSPPVPFAILSRIFAKEPMMPVQSTIPPKHIANRMMDIVHIIPWLPSQDRRSASFSIIGDGFSGSCPMDTPLFRILNTLAGTSVLLTSAATNADSTEALFMNMNGIPISTPPNSEGMAGSLSATATITNIGGSRAIILTLEEALIKSSTSDITLRSTSLPDENMNPMTVYAMRAITRDVPVV